MKQLMCTNDIETLDCLQLILSKAEFNIGLCALTSPPLNLYNLDKSM